LFGCFALLLLVVNTCRKSGVGQAPTEMILSLTVGGDRKIMQVWLQTIPYWFIIGSWEILVGFFYFA
jgi:hypothetical protein